MELVLENCYPVNVNNVNCTFFIFLLLKVTPTSFQFSTFASVIFFQTIDDFK